MIRVLTASVVVAFVLLGCQQQEDINAVKANLEQMDQKFIDTFNKKDLDGLMSLYWNSPDLVALYPDTMVLRGYDAVRGYWQTAFAMVEVKKFELTESHITVGRDMASDWGIWTYTLQPEGGNEITLDGRYSQIWEKKDGNWVITVDHASVTLPPPPEASMGNGEKK